MSDVVYIVNTRKLQNRTIIIHRGRDGGDMPFCGSVRWIDLDDYWPIHPVHRRIGRPCKRCFRDGWEDADG